ncbi:MAG: glycosyl hydrolase, partial [Cyclobacteriaceae bacterium]|nr:glycosyl hydrolase [Cyclobacteriaceae bacterium]
QGAAHGPSEDRGVYKSMDGGQTWKKVLYVDENTGASSLSIDYNNPRILYAATWEHIRLPWQVRSGGAGCTIWKSVDGGETWEKINNGLPKEMGKIGVSVSRANSDRVYAIVEAEKSVAGLYRSDNGGQSWTHMTNNALLTSRSWYYTEVMADPKNQEVVYVMNSPLTKSIDGGKTFTVVPDRHVDTHDIWINPDNPSNVILGDDGGAEISFDGGKSWSTQDNQPTAQFYRVNVDNMFPYKVYGGQQDNSSVVIKSRNNYIGLTEKDWFIGPGCESAFVAFDPNNPVMLFGGCYQGIIDVLDMDNGHTKDIRANPANILAYDAQAMKYRFNWNAPLLASPHDYNTIYHG